MNVEPQTSAGRIAVVSPIKGFFHSNSFYRIKFFIVKINELEIMSCSLSLSLSLDGFTIKTIKMRTQ